MSLDKSHRQVRNTTKHERIRRGRHHVAFTPFRDTDLKNSCVPSERVPNRFDWVWYIVWYSVDAYVIRVAPICPNFGTVSYPNLHIKIPTNLAPSSAQKIRHI